jgi:hypothetical protein
MRVAINGLAIFLAIAFALCLDITDKPSSKLAFVSEAEAIIGRPITPISYAGVARRTTRRAVVMTNSAASASAASAAAVQQSPASPPSAPPPASQQHSPVPTGTIVQTLPEGCSSVVVDGVSYSDCGGVFYKAAFQEDNLVYVVVERPVQ